MMSLITARSLLLPKHSENPAQNSTPVREATQKKVRRRGFVNKLFKRDKQTLR